jgi:hypothetical protein
MMSNYVITVYVSSDPGTYMVRIRFTFQKPGVTNSLNQENMCYKLTGPSKTGFVQTGY